MPDSEKVQKEKDKISIRLSKISFILSVAAGLVIVTLLVLLGMVDNAEVSRGRTDNGYSSVKNYNCNEVEDADSPIGVKKEYTFFLDEVMDRDTYLSFYTVHQYVDVYLDGQNIYSLKPSGKNRLSKTVGSNWTMIPLYREDAGKEICVEITPVYESFRDRKVELLIGSQLAVYKDRLSKDLPQLILGIMAVFVGVVFVCVALHSLFRKHRGKSLAALGLFSIMLGFWRLTDTRFTPFILPDKPVLLFYVSVTMLMLGIVPLIKWTEEYSAKGSRRVLDCYCIVASLICLIQLALQFFGVLDLRDTLVVTHVVIAIGAAVAIINAIYERVKYPEKSMGLIGKKLPLICVAGIIADVAAFYIKGNSSGLLFSLLAFLLYIVFMGIATMFNYSEQEMQLAEKDKLLAEKERKLTERRVATMMSQIRTHFIFNILTAISGMCEYDPKKADETLVRFSRYLRRNIDVMEEDVPELFSKSMEYLEDYIALEQSRFGDKIKFVKDLEVTNFKLPPLLLQPLVENSIKHGILPKPSGGTIKLSTRTDGKNIIITVLDDGVGFNTEDMNKKGSVGISNVRYRLENMVNGSMTIESSIGNGTKVTVVIPRNSFSIS